MSGAFGKVGLVLALVPSCAGEVCTSDHCGLLESPSLVQKKLGKFSLHAGSVVRACSDLEYLGYEEALATGYLGYAIPEPPLCSPPQPQAALGQVVAAAGGASSEHAVHRRASTMVKSRKRKGSPLYAVMVNSYKVEKSWCAHPCKKFTWEKDALKANHDDPNYQVIDAVLWMDEKRVALYHFDKEIETISTYWTICDGSWECPEVVDYRESFLLYEAKWDSHLDHDPEGFSTWLSNELVTILSETTKFETEHIGFAYYGHGSRADGALFEGLIQKEDSKEALQTFTDLSGKSLDLLNFGGNCIEGKWNMADSLHPYTRFILASDLLVGGWTPPTSSSYMNVKNRYKLQNYLSELAGNRPVFVDMLKELLQGVKRIWEAAENEMREQKAKQSLSLYDTAAFPTLQTAIKEDWHGDKVESATQAAESHWCDVSYFCDALGRTDELNQFQIGYVDTRFIFDWASGEGSELRYHTSKGFGFNFLGWKEPPCDIHAATTGTTAVPSCVGDAVSYGSAVGGCATYKQGGANHETCWQNAAGEALRAMEVCPQCGSCAPGSGAPPEMVPMPPPPMTGSGAPPEMVPMPPPPVTGSGAPPEMVPMPPPPMTGSGAPPEMVPMPPPPMTGSGAPTESAPLPPPPMDSPTESAPLPPPPMDSPTESAPLPPPPMDSPTACQDMTLASGSKWHDADSTGFTCDAYDSNGWCAMFGSSAPNEGMSANMACCSCGGGSAGGGGAPVSPIPIQTPSPTPLPTPPPTRPAGAKCYSWCSADFCQFEFAAEFCGGCPECN